MHTQEIFRLSFIHTLEILRPTWFGRFLARRWDIARFPAVFLRYLTWSVGSVSARNIIPLEGRNNLLDVHYHAGTQITSWFCGLFENNYTPVAGDTMATFPAVAGEIVAYAEATRPIWNEAAPVAGVITNSASPATFTFNATKTLFGAFLSSVATKAAITGVLGSAAKFSASKTVDSGDIGRLTASVTFTSV